MHLVTAAVVRLVGTLAHGKYSDAGSDRHFQGCPRPVPEVRGSFSAGTAHPRTTQVLGLRGHAAPVDTECDLVTVRAGF
jgi:hypothetical protein